MTLPSSLSSRLVVAAPQTDSSAIISTVGPEGSGKTAWALTASQLSEGPCVYLPLDRKTKGDYIEDLLRSKRVLVPKTNFKHILEKGKLSQAQADRLWGEMGGLLTDVLTDKTIRTCVVDTGGYMWALLRLARFGKLKQVNPFNYDEANAEYESLLWTAEEHDKLLIIIHKQKKEYRAGKEGKDQWTGQYERAGYSHMGFVANVSLKHFRTEDQGFGVRVLQHKLRPELDGTEMIADECSVPYFCWRTFGGELEDYVA